MHYNGKSIFIGAFRNKNDKTISSGFKYFNQKCKTRFQQTFLTLSRLLISLLTDINSTRRLLLRKKPTDKRSTFSRWSSLVPSSKVRQNISINLSFLILTKRISPNEKKENAEHAPADVFIRDSKRENFNRKTVLLPRIKFFQKDKTVVLAFSIYLNGGCR